VTAQPGLLELASAEQENAKRLLYRFVPICQMLSAIGTLGALFTPLPWAYVIAVLVLVLLVTSWMLRSHGGGLHRRAEEARRRAMLVSAFGADAEQLDAANIRAAMSKRACRVAATKDRSDYWASDEPPGAGRLLGQMQESAFWSCHLYKAAASAMFKVLGAIVFGLIAIAFLGIAIFSGHTDLAVTRVIVVLFSSLIGLDVLGQAQAWQASAVEAERVDRRLETLIAGDLEPMLAAIADYAVATASAPPIPDHVYNSERERLEELWSERSRAQSTGQA
jgi:hypothetical protein